VHTSAKACLTTVAILIRIRDPDPYRHQNLIVCLSDVQRVHNVHSLLLDFTRQFWGASVNHRRRILFCVAQTCWTTPCSTRITMRWSSFEILKCSPCASTTLFRSPARSVHNVFNSSHTV